MQGLRQAKSNDPVLLLDEIDKISTMGSVLVLFYEFCTPWWLSTNAAPGYPRRIGSKSSVGSKY
jgi:hypothetical protein